MKPTYCNTSCLLHKYTNCLAGCMFATCVCVQPTFQDYSNVIHIHASIRFFSYLSCILGKYSSFATPRRRCVSLPASGYCTVASGVHGPAFTYPRFSKANTKPPSPITTPSSSRCRRPCEWKAVFQHTSYRGKKKYASSFFPHSRRLIAVQVGRHASPGWETRTSTQTQAQAFPAHVHRCYTP